MDCKKLATGALILAAFTSGAGFAQESATLKKIKDSGTINLGHRESSIPAASCCAAPPAGKCKWLYSRNSVMSHSGNRQISTESER